MPRSDVALSIDRLGPADLPAALALSTAVGWNQTAADWARLQALAPDGCFAGRVGGRLVATATAADYVSGDVFWIGMVIVAPAERGRGFGTALLRRAVQHARDRGARVIGLDATDLGRPVYLAQGFADVAPIDRWGGALHAGPPGQTRLAIDGALDAGALAFDRQACGLDRSALLRHLAAQPGAAALVARGPSGVAGLAFLRPGREHLHLGPVVADPAALPALLDDAAARLAGRSVLVDAPRSPQIGQALSGRGLGVRRQLQRMTLPRSQFILMGDRVAAATSFEWG